MTTFQALVLGSVQGLTEFLPISSSGHLIFIPKLFGWGDQGLAFDVVVHLGTFLSVVVYFRKKLFSLDHKLALFIVASIIPAGAVGFLFGDWIETYARSAQVVGVSLIFWGVVLAAADGFAKGLTKHNATKILSALHWKNVLFIACAQAVALIPGTSRSGITMSAGLFSGLDKKSAAEFSFLMSIPIIFLAGMSKMTGLWQHSDTIAWDMMALGFAASAVSGSIAIWGLMKIIQRWSFMPFVVYRVLIGIMILLYLK